jgi:site-specific DNA-methyltransferase (adenine-specific)
VSEPYYKDDNATLYLADCREITEWLTADVLVTDPPYGMRYSPRGTYDSATGIGHKPHGLTSIAGDETTEARDAIHSLWGDRPAIFFGTWRQPRPRGTVHRLVWWKRGAAPGPARCAFMLNDEEIYVVGKGWRESSPPMRTVIATNEFRSKQVVDIGHPTPKPLALMQQLIDRCPPGVIADPFAGSGSTLVAAKTLGRKAVGVEIDERYCEIAARRLSQDVLPMEAM